MDVFLLCHNAYGFENAGHVLIDEQQVGCVCFLFSASPLMKFCYVGKHFNELYTGTKQKLLEN